MYLTSRGKYKVREGSISGLFANDATMGGIKMSFMLSIVAAALACIIVVVACNYIFKHKGKKSGVVPGVRPALSHGCCPPYSSAIPTASTSIPSPSGTWATIISTTPRTCGC